MDNLYVYSIVEMNLGKSSIWITCISLVKDYMDNLYVYITSGNECY